MVYWYVLLWYIDIPPSTNQKQQDYSTSVFITNGAHSKNMLDLTFTKFDQTSNKNIHATQRHIFVFATVTVFIIIPNVILA